MGDDASAISFSEAVRLAPKKCGANQTQEDCEREAWKYSLSTICKLVCTATGVGVAVLPFCGVLSGPIANVTFKPLKAFGKFLGEGVQNAIMAVLPSAWKAQGVFCPECLVGEWFMGKRFQPSDPITGPYGTWLAAKEAVQNAWVAACVEAGLPETTPFKVAIPLLLPPAADCIENDPKEWQTATEPDLDPRVWEAGYAYSPEEALMIWLEKYRLGWRTMRTFSYPGYDSSNGYAYVATTKQGGTVDQYIDFAPAPWGYGIRSKGPFGLHVFGWPQKCNNTCLNQCSQAITACWAHRLKALDLALSAVIAGVASQVAIDKNNSSGKQIVVINLEGGLPNGSQTGVVTSGQWSTGSRVLAWTAALTALFGGGYLAYKHRDAIAAQARKLTHKAKLLTASK